MKKLIKKKIKGFFKRFGYIILPENDPLFKSQNAFLEQKMLLGHNNEVTIFDVGAHFGETALKYNMIFNNCTIYSFEPFIESFNVLNKALTHLKNVQTFNLALCNEIGAVSFNLNSDSLTNSILPTDNKGPSTWWVNALETTKTIEVSSTTLDEFVVKNNIDKIDILKLDTQGSEYLVIEGAKESFKKGMVKMIYLEIILMPTYVGQKSFDEIIKLLRINGFKLYDIYNNNYTDNGQLRQVDAIFVFDTFKID